MTRKVVIVGFPGVQALDVVGPHEVFSGASLLTDGGYEIVMASAGGQTVTTRVRPGVRGKPAARPERPHRHGRAARRRRRG